MTHLEKIQMRVAARRWNSSKVFCPAGKLVLTRSYRISSALRDTIRSGRGIRRLVTLCGSIHHLVKESDRRLLGGRDTDDDEVDEEDIPQPSQDPKELARR